MRTIPVLAALTCAAAFWAWPASADIRVLNDHAVSGMLARLQEIDFESLPSDGSVANPLTLGGITFADPFDLRAGFCSSPTCEPDPDNPDGGNISLFLNPGGTISFANPPRVVVLDVQGIGDNPFELLVTDAAGESRTIAGQGRLFAVALLGVTAPAGIAGVEVRTVGGTGGPLALARVAFSTNGR